MNNLNPQIKQMLKELKQAHQKLDLTLTENEKVIQAEYQQQVEKLAHELKKTKWLMKTINTIDGMIGTNPIKLTAEIDFKLDTDSLFEMVDKTREMGKTSMEQMLIKMGQQGDENEMAEVFSHALLPRSYGVSQRVEVKENIEGTEINDQVKGIVDMIVDGGMVRLDYAKMLNHILNDDKLLDSKVFKHNCFVVMQFLRDNQAFTKELYWQQPVGEDVLSIKAELGFKLI
jgi:hypothetical protein